jgi:hypothetical protein
MPTKDFKNVRVCMKTEQLVAKSDSAELELHGRLHCSERLRAARGAFAIEPMGAGDRVAFACALSSS